MIRGRGRVPKGKVSKGRGRVPKGKVIRGRGMGRRGWVSRGKLFGQGCGGSKQPPSQTSRGRPPKGSGDFVVVVVLGGRAG